MNNCVIQKILGKTHIKKFFFSGQITKGGGGKPLEPIKKLLSVRKKLPKPHEPLSFRREGDPELSGPTTKKHFFYVCLPLSLNQKLQLILVKQT